MFLKPVIVPTWKSNRQKQDIDYNELAAPAEDKIFKKFKGVMLAGKYDGT